MSSKKILSTLMGLVLISSLTTTVSAASIDKGQAINPQESVLSGKAKIDDSKTVVSDVLTFDQIVEMIAKDNNITKTEASKQVIKNYAKSNMEKSSLRTTDLEVAKLAAARATYRTVSSQFTVTSEYKPSITFYCETDEGGYFWGINKILNVGINRYYNGLDKGFAGSVYTNLEDAGTIFWIVNGDFYENSTTSVNGGVDINVGESATVKFGASSTSNHYEYCYREGRYTIR